MFATSKIINQKKIEDAKLGYDNLLKYDFFKDPITIDNGQKLTYC